MLVLLHQPSKINRLTAIRYPHFMRITIRRRIVPSYLTLISVSRPVAKSDYACEPRELMHNTARQAGSQCAHAFVNV